MIIPSISSVCPCPVTLLKMLRCIRICSHFHLNEKKEKIQSLVALGLFLSHHALLSSPLCTFFPNDCVLMKVPFYVNLVMLWHLQISQQGATVATRQAHKKLSSIGAVFWAAHHQPEDLNNHDAKASLLSSRLMLKEWKHRGNSSEDRHMHTVDPRLILAVGS